MPSSPHKPTIGLAGGIGSGKSLVARQLASLGLAVIDADALSRQALDQPAVRQTLLQWWGPSILDSAARLDRAAIARRVFNQPPELARLEALIHPIVNARRQELRHVFAADPKIVAIVEDCPLLYEKGIDAQCDRVIFVAASRENQLARVAATRGWSPADLDARQKNQLQLDIKAKRADYIVDNNESEPECLAHVRQVLSKIIHE